MPRTKLGRNPQMASAVWGTDALVSAHGSNVPRCADFPLELSIGIFFKPVYPYPQKALYDGSGDPNDAASLRSGGEK
jgi:hypothetical protein